MVYETALRCVLNKDLREEWERYFAETQNHEQILLKVFEQVLPPPEEENSVKTGIGAAHAKLAMDEML